MRVLVSVRSVEEALLAAHGGAHFIDLKEPAAGALGGLPVPTIRAIVAVLRAAHITMPVSATIGDLPLRAQTLIREQVNAVGACGVDYVKVGIEAGPQAAQLLTWLAGCGWPVVPVFIADQGVDVALVHDAAALGFPALMLDTANKDAGSLFDLLSTSALQAFVQSVHSAGCMAGLAGALRLQHLPALVALAPDFAGFRSAVCAQTRSGPLDAQRLHTLCTALAHSTASRCDPVFSTSQVA